MTMLRQNAIARLEKVPEDKLDLIIQFIDQLAEKNQKKENAWDLDQFVMPPTKRGQNADSYVRELRDYDRI